MSQGNGKKMGRPPKYHSKEERRLAQRAAEKRWRENRKKDLADFRALKESLSRFLGQTA